MQVDYLTGRLNRLKSTSKHVAALAEIRGIRLRLAVETGYRKIASDRFFDEALELFKKNERPFQNWALIEKLDWKKCSEIIRKLLRELVKAGLKDGSVQALSRDLENESFTFDLSKAALDRKRETFFSLAAKYNVEPELLRYVLVTPLIPVFHRLQELLAKQEYPVAVTECPLCGAAYSNGIYQAGYRFVICSVCNHRVRVDTFFCPRCGNTKPDEMGFLQSKEEPILQIDYCHRCKSYFKMAHEELMGTFVSDAVLLDLATMDLDSLGKELAEKRAGAEMS